MNQPGNKKRIILTGGGTAGSVAPLLALYTDLRRKRPALDFVWLGTYDGPEKDMVENQNIPFTAIAGGKLRRYFSWRNLTDVFWVLAGFCQSLKFIRQHRPDLVLSAGSFISVPVVWAARLLRVPVLVHQQDARPGLANRLMAPFASAITVTFESSLEHFGSRAVWTGNPVRREIKSFNIAKQEAVRKMGLRGNKNQVVLIMGGGTGAQAINELVAGALPKLTDMCQVIHITGRNRGDLPELDRAETQDRNYKKFDFLQTDGLVKAYTVADIVVSRCGMSSLTELSFLAKPCILIPIPDSHQEDNAAVFRAKEAAKVLDQTELDPETFAGHISELVHDREAREKLAGNIKYIMRPDANRRLLRLIDEELNR